MLHAALVMGWAYHASTKTSPVASETWKWMKSTAAAMNMPAETNMDVRRVGYRVSVWLLANCSRLDVCVCVFARRF